MEKLLHTWKNWAEGAVMASENQTLPEDGESLDALTGDGGVVRWSSWRECREGFDPWDKKAPLHTGLVPLPFVGDVRNAKVVFLLLNPGLSASDYHAEYQVPGFRERLLANLRQDFLGREYPFFPLDPECAWHSGNTYWQGKLRHILEMLCEETGLSHAKVRQFLARNVCAIEMLPYHSVRQGISVKAMQGFPSSKLACTAVNGLVKQALDRSRMLVAMRQVKGWGVPLDCPHVRCFSGGQARGAHLGTREDGTHGQFVAKFLKPFLSPR